MNCDVRKGIGGCRFRRHRESNRINRGQQSNTNKHTNPAGSSDIVEEPAGFLLGYARVFRDILDCIAEQGKRNPIYEMSIAIHYLLISRVPSSISVSIKLAYRASDIRFIGPL